MALVTVVGYPCSGKSTRAKQLEQFLQAKLALPSTSASLARLKIVTVNDEALGLDKSAYDDARSEKPARASLFSAMQRHCSRDTITIIDAMNYIKGSRYQMYCQAREVGVRTCTVWIATPPDHCKEWNKSRSDGLAYADATLENLISRFEEPNSSARWDAPLITVASFDPALHVRPGSATDSDVLGSAEAERIWEAITTGDVKPPNVATLPVHTASTSYLTQLESVSSALISALLSRQALSPLSGPTTLTLGTTPPVKVALTINKNLSMPVLQRLKKQFVKLNQHTGKELSKQQMATLYAEYLEANVR